VTKTVLVTGSDTRVDPVATALRAAGAEVLAATDLDQLKNVVTPLPPGSVVCYVQLPVALRPAGDTVVSRVRCFLEEGLLTRFRLAEAVLPALSGDGRVVLVAGNAPAQAGTPDDAAARFGLLHVLANAVRADKASAQLGIQVVEGTRDPEDVARLALTGEPDERDRAGRDSQLSYQDWRTEVLGMASFEF
jgi:hypothetical protein